VSLSQGIPNHLQIGRFDDELPTTPNSPKRKKMAVQLPSPERRTTRSSRPPPTPKGTLEILSEAGYLIPIQEIPKSLMEQAQKTHLIRIYQEKKCAKCPYLEDRHSENCDRCEGFVGARQTAKKVVYKEREYFSIPRGQKSYLNRLLEKFPHEEIRIKSTHLERPMTRPISLLEETPLRDWQIEAIGVAYKKRRGIIKAPPRSGKTVFGAGLVCKIGQKTLILAHQREWLVQFRETFVGSRTQDKFTDAEESQVGFARNLADFKKYDICLCTFSQFFSDKGKATLAKIRSMFAVVLVDECLPENYFVLTEAGRKQLKDVQPADSVLSFNHSTNSTEFRPVEKAWTTSRPDFVEVTVSGVTYKCTPEHPWFCVNRNDYVKAKDLKPGDEILLTHESDV